MFPYLSSGWAYDLKTVSEEMIVKRAARTGDGTNRFSQCIPIGGAKQKKSDLNQELPRHQQQQHADHNHNHHHHHHHPDENMIWGWDDEDMPEVDRKDALIINKKIE